MGIVRKFYKTELVEDMNPNGYTNAFRRTIGRNKFSIKYKSGTEGSLTIDLDDSGRCYIKDWKFFSGDYVPLLKFVPPDILKSIVP